MADRRRPRRSSAVDRKAKENTKGAVKIGVAVAAVAVVAGLYFVVARGNKDLDANLCPATPASITVLLVDVTDPMTVAQRQDFQNQLLRLRNSIPRYGKLIVAKVDTASQQLLQPVIVRCNPGTAASINEATGNPKAVQKMHDRDFVEPLDRAFASLSQASGADRSPIMESVQSVALTELLTPDAQVLPRRLVLASDLIQHTNSISFYEGVPDAQTFVASNEFRRVRADLRNIEVELWQLERADAPQPRSLVELWDQAITAQGGVVTRAYNVSG